MAGKLEASDSPPRIASGTLAKKESDWLKNLRILDTI